MLSRRRKPALTRPPFSLPSCRLASVVLGLALLTSLAFVTPGQLCWADDNPSPRSKKALPPRQLTDDVATPLDPQQDRSDREKLRLRAVSHFATGRLYERREQLPEALRYYQRAVRYDPTTTRVLRRTVEVAQRLDRYDVAARYAVLLSERDSKDELALLRAMIYLSSTEQDERAIGLYESALAAGAERKDEIWFELHKIAGGVYKLLQRPQLAAKALSKVRHALEKPETYNLDKETYRLNDETAQALYLIMSDAFLDAGRPEDAMAALELAKQHDTDKSYAAFAEARILLKQDDAEAALEKLALYFKSNSEEAGREPYRLLEDILQHQGRSDRYIKRLETLLADHPGNTTLGTYLAEQYSKAGRPQDAKRLHLKLIKSRPTAEGYRALAGIYREAGDVQQLLELLGDLVVQADSLAPLGDELAAILKSNRMRTALFAEGRKLDKQAIDRTFGSYLAIGMLAMEAKQFDIAKEFYGRILKSEHPERPSVLLSWGLDLLMAKQYAASSSVLQQGLDEKLFAREQSVINYYLSGALVMQDRFDEAIVAAQKAVDKQPDSAESLSRLAWVLFQAKKTDASKKLYQSLIAQYGSTIDSLEHREIVRDARLSLSQLHSQANDIPRATELLEQVLDEYPEHIGAKNDLAYLWAEENSNLLLAELFSRDALGQEPDNAAYRDTLGWIYYRQQKYEAAIAELRRAVELLEEPDGVVLDHLGDALDKAGRRDEALGQWRLAVTAFDNSQAVDKKKQVQYKLDNNSSNQ